MEIIINSNIDEKLTEYLKKMSKVEHDALAQGGIQLINWIVNGSPYCSRIPPVLEGTLRSSGSVFVGDKLVHTTGEYANLTHSAPVNVITIGFNTEYATYMHEGDWMPGPVSKRSGDVGNKFVEQHLKSDAEAWLKFVSALISEAMG